MVQGEWTGAPRCTDALHLKGPAQKQIDRAEYTGASHLVRTTILIFEKHFILSDKFIYSYRVRLSFHHVAILELFAHQDGNQYQDFHAFTQDTNNVVFSW